MRRSGLGGMEKSRLWVSMKRSARSSQRDCEYHPYELSAVADKDGKSGDVPRLSILDILIREVVRSGLVETTLR